MGEIVEIGKIQGCNKVNTGCFSLQAESLQQQSCQRFEIMSDKAKEELQHFKGRRVQAFKKNLVELAELQIKHGRAQCSIISQALQGLSET